MKEEYEDAVAQRRSDRRRITRQHLNLPDSRLPMGTTRVVDWLERTRLLTKKDLEITGLTAPQILEKIKSRDYTAVAVTKAFCNRATLAHQLVNCITEPLFQQALSKAEELDQHYAQTGQLVGPLHGLPFSLKDEFDLEGVRTTLCLCSRANCKPATKTSTNIKILIDSGAIPICKTTTPTAAFNIETYSDLFGVTMNPYNTDLSPGGSTGGEAVLLAMKGSPLGVGSDLGGSIRQPCSFHGLFGLRMSTARTTHCSPEAVVYGMESLKPTNGPLARDLETVEMYAKLMAEEAWKKDINTVNKPWTPAKKDSYTLAVLYDDGKIEPTKPIAGALQETVKALEAQGHTVLTWSKKQLLTEIAEFADIFMASNGFKRIIDSAELSGEEIPGLEEMKKTKDLTITELWQLQEQRMHKCNKFWGEWLRLGIDGLIMPVTAFAGCRFGEFVDVSYSPLANVLDVPACAFPVMPVDEALKKELSPKKKFLSDKDKTVHELYDEKTVKGMIAGLQVLGARLEEETVLDIVRVIREALQEN